MSFLQCCDTDGLVTGSASGPKKAVPDVKITFVQNGQICLWGGGSCVRVSPQAHAGDDAPALNTVAHRVASLR